MAAFRHPLLALVLSFAFLATGPAAEIARVLCGPACGPATSEHATEALGCCPVEALPCATPEQTPPENEPCHEDGLCGCVCGREQGGVLPALATSLMAPLAAKADAGTTPCPSWLHMLRQARCSSHEYSLTSHSKVFSGRLNAVLCTFLC